MGSGLEKETPSFINCVSMVAEPMRRTGEQPADSPAEKRNLLSVAHTSAGGSRCGAWRIVTSAEQKKDLVREFIDKAADAPVMSQRQEAASQKERETVEVPQVQYIDEIIDVSIEVQRQVPTAQTVRKTEEASLVQLLDRVLDGPVAIQRQVLCASMPQERITGVHR